MEHTTTNVNKLRPYRPLPRRYKHVIKIKEVVTGSDADTIAYKPYVLFYRRLFDRKHFVYEVSYINDDDGYCLYGNYSEPWGTAEIFKTEDEAFQACTMALNAYLRRRLFTPNVIVYDVRQG